MTRPPFQTLPHPPRCSAATVLTGCRFRSNISSWPTTSFTGSWMRQTIRLMANRNRTTIEERRENL